MVRCSLFILVLPLPFAGFIQSPLVRGMKVFQARRSEKMLRKSRPYDLFVLAFARDNATRLSRGMLNLPPVLLMERE